MNHKHFPNHWVTAPLEDVTAFVTSGSRGWSDYYSESGPLFLRVGNLDHDTVHIDLSDSVHVQPPSGSEGLRTRVEEGDILISITAEVGMIGLARQGLGEAYVNQHVALVRPLPSLYPEGLAYSLLDPQGLQAVVRREQYGATKPGLSLIQVRRFEVPVPPLLEQRRIVEAIESHLTRLDDAVATLERVERNLKRYRASVLKAAVEGRLVRTEAAQAKEEGRDYEPAAVLLERILTERRRRWSESGKKSKYQEPAAPDTVNLPDLPEGWCWATVDQLAHVGTGATPKRGNDRFWKNGTIPWVTSSVVNERRVVVPSELVTEAALAETNLTLYRPGTLLVAMYGEGKTRGMISELAIEAATNQALAAIVLEGDAMQLREWFLVFFMHNYTELRRAASGGVQPNLNLSIVKALPVPLPPAGEQRRIASEVELMLSLVEAVGKSVGVQQARSARLRQSILKWAFEGRLADRDPKEEPASVLLERIKADRRASKPEKTASPQRAPVKKVRA